MWKENLGVSMKEETLQVLKRITGALMSMVYCDGHTPEDTFGQTGVRIWFHHISVSMLWFVSGYIF
jgi:hypothetical protein